MYRCNKQKTIIQKDNSKKRKTTMRLKQLKWNNVINKVKTNATSLLTLKLDEYKMNINTFNYKITALSD